MGYDQGADATIKGSTLLSTLVKRGHQIANTVEGASERLHQEIDALLGGQPEMPAAPGRDRPDGPEPTQHGGMFGELEAVIQRLEMVAQKVEAAVGRACRLNN